VVGSKGIKGLLTGAALSLTILGSAHAKTPVGGEYNLPSWWRTSGASSSTPSRDTTRKQNFTKIYQENDDNLVITTWNMLNVGNGKSKDPEFRSTLKELVRESDIFVGQEVRSERAAEELCELVEDTHDCTYTTEAGKIYVRDGEEKLYHKEVYWFAMRKDKIELEDLIDYNTIPSWRKRVVNGTMSGKLSRPPGVLRVNHGGYTIDIVTVHTDPDEATEELAHVEAIVRGRKYPTIYTGDFNECQYGGTPGFSTFVGTKRHDTTVGNNDCAYDVAEGNQALQNLYNSIQGEVLDVEGSDHYPIRTWLGRNYQGAE
jgi:endonuclease/exonuclease/phosphatase family metal-dependent hydrolase